ncbi:FtsK/SpoIIIE domain-containing protein [Actinoplanes aureus]|uniref:Cell division protein FtsK n=1 Tax=Actinoplanes aureus TaxID=2792083 RepID=A0A931G760_9ACTN|nr:FtsK/SpoIIIE domain-containing protein [Actinoplanes aureus]MBG0567914.1 cell division protein FtsK [Actinoplanes aureus]
MPPVLTADAGNGPVDLGPVLSIFDPVHIGIDEFGQPKLVPLIERNMLIGGEPGSGKSGLLNAVVGHAAMSLDCRLVLFDGKRVELGQWRKCADAFVGPNLEQALLVLRKLQMMMDRRYDYLEDCERRKIIPADVFQAYLVAFDELAYYSATIGRKVDRDEFSMLLRDLVARGRAVGIIVVAATQRPSSDIIPTSLRDLFAWRFAGRCTNDSSSDIVLGHGWAQKGWSANMISPNNPGAGLLISESGSPQLIKVAYLDDRTCAGIAAYAATLRDAVRDNPPTGIPVLRAA